MTYLFTFYTKQIVYDLPLCIWQIIANVAMMIMRMRMMMMMIAPRLSAIPSTNFGPVSKKKYICIPTS